MMMVMMMIINIIRSNIKLNIFIPKTGNKITKNVAFQLFKRKIVFLTNKEKCCRKTKTVLFGQ